MKLHGVKEGYVEVGDGHALWFFDTGGDGIPVVLLHAGVGSGRVWEHQIPAFAAAGYRLIGYSRRGHAGSILGDHGAPGIGAADLLTLVDHLNLKEFHLVGTAAGGMVAADFTISHEQRLLSLVLANTIVGVSDADYRAIQTRLWPHGFDALPPDFRELSPSYRHLEPEGCKRWTALVLEARAAALPDQAFANDVTWHRLAAWQLPVLLLTGDADLYMPPSVMRLLNGRIPGSESRLVADCGHSAFWEQPDIFNRLVLAFICRHGPAQRLDSLISA
jgi:pimeloyl-ACP methyl ester carboxylesterase